MFLVCRIVRNITISWSEKYNYNRERKYYVSFFVHMVHAQPMQYACTMCMSLAAPKLIIAVH